MEEVGGERRKERHEDGRRIMKAPPKQFRKISAWKRYWRVCGPEGIWGWFARWVWEVDDDGLRR